MHQLLLLESINGAAFDISELRTVEQFSIKFFRFFTYNRKHSLVSEISRASISIPVENYDPSILNSNTVSKLSITTVLLSFIPALVLIIFSLLVTLIKFQDDLLQITCPHLLVYSCSFIITALQLLFIPICIFGINHIRDGLGIRREYTTHFVVCLGFYILYVVNTFSSSFILKGNYSSIFGVIALVFSNISTVIYPVYLVLAKRHRGKRLNTTFEIFEMVLRDKTHFEGLKKVILFNLI